MAGFDIEKLKKLVDPQWNKRVDRYKKMGFSDEQKLADATAYKKKLISTYSAMNPEIVDYINSLKY